MVGEWVTVFTIHFKGAGWRVKLTPTIPRLVLLAAAGQVKKIRHIYKRNEHLLNVHCSVTPGCQLYPRLWNMPAVSKLDHLQQENVKWILVTPPYIVTSTCAEWMTHSGSRMSALWCVRVGDRGVYILTMTSAFSCHTHTPLCILQPEGLNVVNLCLVVGRL